MDRRTILTLTALSTLLLVLSGLWLFHSLGAGNRGFILQLRGAKLVGLIVVGLSVGVATMAVRMAAAASVIV